MQIRPATIMIWLLTLSAYLARPLSCAAALRLEVTPPGNPYHSVDPHGFGMLGAMMTALLLIGPVGWLLLQSRPLAAVAKAPIGRTAAIMLVIATPMLLQLTYLNMRLEWCWPVIFASVVWAAVVLALCLRTAPGSLSGHGAFDRSPRIAWTLVASIGLGKIAVFMLSLA